MAEPVYDQVAAKIPSQVNPCYGVANVKPLDPATTMSKFEAKKPSYDRFHWCVVIGLVLVGVVVCASMAVAVWSLAKVNGVEQAQVQISLSKLYSNVSAAIDLLRADNSRIRKEVQTFLGSVQANISSSMISTVEARIDAVNTSISDVELFQSELVEVMQALSSQLAAVEDRIDTVNDRIDASVSNAVDLFQSELNKVMQALSGQLPSTPANSCLSLSTSGHYWVRASNGSAVLVYCDVMMIRSCGDVDGGWRRVASMDFSNSTTPCPSGLQERIDSGIRTCGIQSSHSTYASVFSSSGTAYDEICGKIIAYQMGTPDAFANRAIDSNYVDGVSLTHGSNPRHHIWTFAAALDEYGESGTEACECSHSGRRSGRLPPAFVGQDYFCDSGIPRRRIYSSDNGRFFSMSPLWDGSGCGHDSTCCSFNNPPWFYKQLPSPTSDAIEMRVCADENRSNEDIAISSVVIYIH